jgi:hypothetical protein
MKPLRLLMVVAGAVVLPALIGVQSAEAQRCSSLCNQIRRACIKSAKATRKAELATCDASRETCRTECQTNAGSCLGTCDDTNTTCLAGCESALDPSACGEDCAAALLQCQDDCANCAANCNAGRETCRTEANTKRTAGKDTCDGWRMSCRDACVDPIDRPCTRGCKSDLRQCAADAKKAERTCKKGVEKGPARKAGIRSCRQAMNQALGICSDLEVTCLAGCAEVTLEEPS